MVGGVQSNGEGEGGRWGKGKGDNQRREAISSKICPAV